MLFTSRFSSFNVTAHRCTSNRKDAIKEKIFQIFDLDAVWIFSKISSVHLLVTINDDKSVQELALEILHEHESGMVTETNIRTS